MIAIELKLDGDGAWPDFEYIIETDRLIEANALKIAALGGGMKSGNPSVSIRLDLPGGGVALAQTSLALFLMAADALKARYGDPRMDGVGHG